jgi:LmeA-like phospholipid-binding
MSSDPNQPTQPPARRSTEPQDEPAPPTVRMPVQPAGQDSPAGQSPPPGRWQEPATAPAPQWRPTPPPAQAGAAQAGAAQAAPQWTPQPAQPAGAWGTPPPAPPQPGAQWGPQAPAPRVRRGQRRRRTRRSVMVTFTIVVVLILLVIVDRVANAVTENAFASQFQSQGVPVKPSVSIEGFPFLTQLAAKDFNKVDISASNIPVNLPTGGSLSITSVHATVNGLHISGYSSSANATVDHITATAFVSFGSLAAAGSLGGTGVTLTQAGPNTVKITAGLAGIASDTEEAQILQTGPQTIEIKIVNNGGGLGSVLGSVGFNSFSFTLPKVVPASLRITGLTLNSQGLTVSAAASHATFSQSSTSK